MDKNLTQQRAEDIRGHLPEYLPNTVWKNLIQQKGLLMQALF
jgi:hypothetical protein